MRVIATVLFYHFGLSHWTHGKPHAALGFAIMLLGMVALYGVLVLLLPKPHSDVLTGASS
jgi:hypothetical protein